MTEISIIVPVYKVEQFLPRCIDSILNQTFTDFELILVDDGSPDNCGRICDEYAKKDSRIRVIHKENGGVSSARNIGINEAKGKYIMFCDSDDYVDNNWCETLYKEIVKNPNVFVTCNCWYESIDHINKKNLFSIKDESVHETDYFDIFLMGISYSVVLKIFKKDVLCSASIRFDPDRKIGEDAEFCARYAYCCDQFLYISTPLYHYINNPHSATHKYRHDILSITIPLLSIRLPLIKDEQYEPFFQCYFNMFLSMLEVVFDERNTAMSMRQKYEYTNRMLNTQEFRMAIKYGAKHEKWYNRFLLKNFDYRIYRYFRKICNSIKERKNHTR